MVAGFTKKLFSRVRGWMDSELISDVPGDIAACEFECKRPECSDETFIGCERRKRGEEQAAMAAETEAVTKAPEESELPAAVTQRPPSVAA